MRRPTLVVPPTEEREATDKDIETALAIIKALLKPSVLIPFALHLEAMAMEHAHGGLDCSFDMYDGRPLRLRLAPRYNYPRPGPDKPRA